MSCDFIHPSHIFANSLQQDGTHTQTADLVNVLLWGCNCEYIPDIRVSHQCGSGAELSLMAWQVKAPASAVIWLNEKARAGALHKQLIRESANYWLVKNDKHRLPRFA